MRPWLTADSAPVLLLIPRTEPLDVELEELQKAKNRLCSLTKGKKRCQRGGTWPCSLRFRASRGTPSTAVRSGSLLEFLWPRSDDRGALVSSSFPSPDAGRGPAAPADVRSAPHGHSGDMCRKRYLGSPQSRASPSP